MKQQSHSRWATVMIAALLLIGCASQAGSPDDDLTDEPTLTEEPTVEPTETDTPENGITMEAPTPLTPSDTQVPEAIIQAMIADLAGKITADSAEIILIEAQEVVWNDGSLGCPEPGMSYTMAQVPGYYVVLQAENQPHYYHAAANSGHFFECENPSGAPMLPES